MYLLKEKTASDVQGLITAQEKCISYSDDINWILFLLRRKLNEVNNKIKRIKSPATAMLINKGRMGNDLINSEVLFLHEELYDLNDSKETIERISDYLERLNENLNKYLWIIREKLKI